MSDTAEDRPITLQKKRVVHQGEVLTFTRETLAVGNSQIEKDLVYHPGAVVILPVTAKGEVLLVRQYRYVCGRYLLELPAGTLEPGEDPRSCAERELAEEVSYAASEWHGLGTLVPAPGFCNELLHCFLARELRPSSASLDIDEVLSVVAMTQPELDQAICSGELCDAKTIALLQRARLMGLL